MEDFRCRSAKASDQEDLNEISKNLYSGADNTPYMFKKWLSDENWLLYVAEEKCSEHVIGFLALSISDDRTRVTVRSSRVAETKRGMGVYTLLLDYALLSAQKCCKKLKSVIRIRKIDFKFPETYEIKEKFRLVTVRIDLKHDMKGLCNDAANTQGWNISRRRLSDLYDTQINFRELFPGHNIDVDFTVYDVDLLESRVYIDSRKDLTIFYSSNDSRSKESNGHVKQAFCIVGLCPQEDTTDNFFTPVVLYGNDASMLQSHVSNVIGMVAEAAMNCGKNSFLLKMWIHSHEREDLARFMKEETKLEVLADYEMNVLEADIEKHPFRYCLSDIQGEN